jgi:DNA sulfur modification protein DndE
MIPHRVRVSERTTARLKFLKSKTGLTPNILNRLAFVLSVRELRRVAQVSARLSGQEFNAPTLFGEYQRAYELLLSKYLSVTSDDRDINLIIASHIENGLHKMGHVRSLEDVAALG